jgi:endonuclease YncB( thermonuclease family)
MMSSFFFRRVLPAILLFGATIIPGPGAEQREWVTLTNCQLVASEYNDGDSFRIRGGTNEFIVRLYFVDAPETNLRYPERTREQAEYFGITLDETLKAGVQARDAVRELLREPFVVQTRWASAMGRTKTPRYYASVQAGGTNLAEVLVARGLARTKGVTATSPIGGQSKAFAEKLQALETEARQKRLGAWATATAKKPEAATQ